MYAILDETNKVIGLSETETESSILLTQEQYGMLLITDSIWYYDGENFYKQEEPLEPETPVVRIDPQLYALLSSEGVVEGFYTEEKPNTIPISKEDHMKQMEQPGKWTYEDGSFVRYDFDPIVKSEEEILFEKQMLRADNERKSMKKLAELQVISLLPLIEDADLEEVKYIFPEWGDFIGLELDPIAYPLVIYNDELYTVLSKHTVQEAWTPTAAPSLFAKKLTAPDGTPKEWVKPGAENGYSIGDKVIFEGKVYESLIDDNVWSPTENPQGWKEEPPVEGEDGDSGEIEPWEQPTAGDGRYTLGAIVSHKGETWVSVHDGLNVWEPGEYGWELKPAE